MHCFFIKNHDFFGFKISMDFWMVSSLKMASKSKPFSMKKSFKKQDVFRASQKSFFFAFLERSGTVPDDRIDFFSFFFYFWPKMIAKGDPNGRGQLAGNIPKTLPKRSHIASATEPRLFINFAWILDPIFIDF